MSKEKQMFEDLVEIFEEEYEKRRLITPQNTAEKMTAKGYRKQKEGEWVCRCKSTFPQYQPSEYECSVCKCQRTALYKYCPDCGAKMKGGGE